MKQNDAQKVTVIGAGTMGSGIAMHLANCGFKVSLLDLTLESVNAAFQRAKNVKPPHLYNEQSEHRITLGSIADNLNEVCDSNWVCEAIIEKLDAKRDLYAQLEPLLAAGTFISTNTSGIELSLLKEGRSDSFRRNFLGTHFFNPPRYLKLLELIPTDETDPDEISRMTEYLESRVGRRVVIAKDTPGFIANRFGMWAMIHCVHVAEKLRMSVEEVDALTGPFLGRPRSASFRLNDLVGMDIMADIASNLSNRCADDQWKPNLELPRSVQHLLDNGHLGQKSGKGYYVKEGKSMSALDLETLLYRDLQPVDLPSLSTIEKLPLGERISKALSLGDDVGEFMRRHLIPVFQYADSIRDEISHSVEDFDRVMMWGFGWQQGPFQMMDTIGHEQFGISPEPFYRENNMRTTSGGYVPRKVEPQYQALSEYKFISDHETFRVRDVNGVQTVCLKTKLGTITPDLVTELYQWVRTQDDVFMLANEQRFFSVGYDLSFFLKCTETHDMDAVTRGLRELQDLCDLLRTKKCISAVHGFCLGAGYEIASACTLKVCHPDVQLGLPEVKVGLLPGGSGTALMRARSSTSLKSIVDNFSHVLQGYTSTSAADAQFAGFIRPSDIILVHPDSLIFEASHLANSIPEPYEQVIAHMEGPLGGMIDKCVEELLHAGKITAYDAVIAKALKNIYVKSTNWEDALSRERMDFVELLSQPHTHARITHMLETGKPLRN